MLGRDEPEVVSPLSAFAPIGHALFAGDGVRLAFGLLWDDTIVHISQVKRGAACGCRCPAPKCNRKLIARKSDADVAHHFAHSPITTAERAAGISPTCAHGAMTALHRYAEVLLNEKKQLVLPPVSASLDGISRTMRPAEQFEFDKAELETMDGETVPDVILWKGERRMHVEFRVTHRCGSKKTAKIIAANISAVEIDLTGLPKDAAFDGLNEAILESAPREWIHNRRSAEILEQLRAEADVRKAHEERRRRERQVALTDAYARARSKALASRWKEEPDVVRVEKQGDAELLGVRSPGEGFFAVHPKTWRAAILVLMHDSFGGCTPAGIIAELDRRGWLVGMLRGHRCGEEEAADANLPDGGAEGAVQRFLRALAKRGIAEDHGWKWTYTQNHRDRIATRRMTRERLEREAAARAARLACLRTLARTAVDATSSHERSQFDIELWCSFATEAAPQSPLRIAEDGGAEWNVLERGLILAAAVLKDEKEEQAADFGLPISQSLAAMREIHLARAEQRKSEAEAAALRDRNARIDALVRSSAEALGDDHRDWLDGPDPMLKATPRDAAAESAERLSAARQQLAVHVARKRIKERWLDELKRSAAILLRRPDWLAPYLDSPDPKLPGRVSPRVHTTDQASMMECLALLKQRSGR